MPLAANPNPNPTLLPLSPALLFPVGTPPQLLGAPQFSPVPAPHLVYQKPTVLPPDIASAPAPPQMQPMMSYQVLLNNPVMRPFALIPNGYTPSPTTNPREL
ncbi:unnamed protein product [Sphenostylis stenocarpa]|uniref:Uncharacterized protein n=1 Tax=Sphenostylis stenocarpa TaxID=92480 RepID=A0AA86VHS3_9FABA|nr:unnamed protein product [Sphenostylis stenocarpa]